MDRGPNPNLADRLLPWFKLKTLPGLGNHTCKQLLEKFQTPEGIFEATPDALRGIYGVGPRLVEAMATHRTPDWIKGEIEQIHRRGYRVVTYNDPDYPGLLRQIPDPPPLLYVKGRLDGGVRGLALVGSRKATRYGLSAARRLGSELAAAGFTIVSGMARGIDTAAHEGALQGNGTTIAVLGSGLEKVYPSVNRGLFERIAQKGAVISEFFLQTDPEGHNFPVRNRIISGISLGTVVVEAARRSGSLITARLAAEQNREVFAVPGSIRSFTSSGTHILIKQGAKLVDQIGDILEELEPWLPPAQVVTPPRADAAPQTARCLERRERGVLEALDAYPVHIDGLARRLGMDSGRLAGILLKLELLGLVEQLPGKNFARK